MIALVVLLPAILGALVALIVRKKLRRIGLMTWLGWLMIGAGLPVLFGQVAALMLTDAAQMAANRCDMGEDAACMNAGLYFILPLTAGLCGGLGWAAGALSARLTAPRKTS